MGRVGRKNASDPDLRRNRCLEQLLVPRGLQTVEPLRLRVKFDRQCRARPAQPAEVMNADPDSFRILFLHEPCCEELRARARSASGTSRSTSPKTRSVWIARRRLGPFSRRIGPSQAPRTRSRRGGAVNAATRASAVGVEGRGGSVSPTLERVRRQRPRRSEPDIIGAADESRQRPRIGGDHSDAIPPRSYPGSPHGTRFVPELRRHRAGDSSRAGPPRAPNSGWRRRLRLGVVSCGEGDGCGHAVWPSGGVNFVVLGGLKSQRRIV